MAGAAVRPRCRGRVRAVRGGRSLPARVTAAGRGAGVPRAFRAALCAWGDLWMRAGRGEALWSSAQGNSTGHWPRGSAWDVAPAGAALGTLTQQDEPEKETLLPHVPRRAPASLLLSGMALGDTSTQRVAPGLASLPEGRGWASCCSELLIRDIHACAWLGIRGAPVPDPATRHPCCSCRG
ncbi:uncharacterized protein LOC119700930 isoform X3 [Motacilla alba alba]|uniref:uncharacterized protein LOC119700930 isoform X3 n=1 Tax=Motacilla alba alba TaxID=1094192 RepID=UPI0018D599A4|nr:uncharacterized protein LOC119700930 isoform X3 [Motacilla alba alba]